MAIIFPDPSLQTPVNTFSPTSTPDATTNGLTYIWDNALGVWTSSAGGGGGGGVTSVGVTSPLTNSGTATAPVIGIPDATTGTKGAVSVGTNLQVTSGAISVPDASDTTKGVSEIATAAEAATGTDATRTLSPATGVPKVLADMTGAAIIPGGDDTERAAITSPTDGMLRYNDTTAPSVMEYYDGSQWVDLATGGSAVSSSWEKVSVSPAFKVQAVAYGNGKFLAVGGAAGPLSASTSVDGYTWTAPVQISATTSDNSVSATFANGVFLVSFGSVNRTFTSADGVAWNTGAATAAPLNWIAGGGGVFVAVAGGGTPQRVYTSADGLNWTQGSSPSGTFNKNVIHITGTTYRLLGWSGAGFTIYESTDGGANWSAAATFASGTGSSASIAYDGAKHLLTVDGGVYSSASGSGAGSYQMVGAVIGSTTQAVVIAWPTGVSVLTPTLGNSTVIQVSSDSFQTSISGGSSGAYSSVAINNSEYGVGFNGSILMTGNQGVGVSFTKIA